MQDIKKSIITSSVTDYTINIDIIKDYRPKAGDVGIFEVLSLGKHKAIQDEQGNHSYIFEGDQFLATFGTRYASEQFEGYVPSEYQEKYEILGQGGVVGVLKSWHTNFDDIGATHVKLIGYAVNDKNQVINTIDLYKEQNGETLFSKDKNYKIYLSIGSSMDSGKTTTAAFFSRGAKLLQKTVAYIKLTGTVYAKDCKIVKDCGAKMAVDFSHCGYPSTYMESKSDILQIYAQLLHTVEAINPDIVVVEIADGLLQQETYELISDKNFMSSIEGVILSCRDSLAIKGGIDILQTKGIRPICVSGWFTASPLMVKEVKKISSIPVYSIYDFLKPNKMKPLISS